MCVAFRDVQQEAGPIFAEENKLTEQFCNTILVAVTKPLSLPNLQCEFIISSLAKFYYEAISIWGGGGGGGGRE